MKKTKVAALLSGGIDSSYTAYLLKEAGYEVEGVYLKLHEDESKHAINIANVEKVGEFLDIKTHVIDAKAEFKKVVYDAFVASYEAGLTPNPCALCNPHMKFGLALRKALEMGCEKIATGHYAQVKNGRIAEAVDESKDQSYFLFGISQEAIERVIFPLGGLIKEELKPIALEKLPWLGSLQTYKESQDVCFIANDYMEILRLHVKADEPGTVTDQEGNTVGTHQGYMHYTVGKRRGFRIDGAHEPHYVLRTDPKTNTVVVGKKEELQTTFVRAKNLSLPVDFKEGEYGIKVRYRSPKVRAHVRLLGEEIIAQLQEPVYGVAAGQALVVYEEDRVLGGGWLE
ncbi:tRNA 2-thiouridine(34) synthase MnmA [Sulfurospirillum sp. T05]|uniref:tRNA-specific 2-thiouridylase MnmA n=1 Tax=Sulfurospirillum tamanense TaxID=2813362 RepID=A0ABS2WRZ4_9BACT|nr:tRNA 2-thiouridine(34) synthase MnmA [Sulfurospirillum tamanensis]MBN2964382.1 tRNA 2-thiouridine(34) synthase MnmA [Sulfurospirillum tamanensis]